MIQNILFLDIETVPLNNPKSSDQVDEGFVRRFYGIHPIDVDSEEYERNYSEKASLYAEHCKIVAISIGKINSKGILYVKSLVGKHEDVLLNQLADAIQSSGATSVCAHNGTDFDFAILFRRYIINRIKVPALLNRTNKKTWDPGQIDTMNIWAGPQWKYKVSLDLLAITLGLPSPKSEMSGADVADLYYGMLNVPSEQLPFEKEEANFKKIGDYCNRDVITMIDIFIIMMELTPPKDQQAVYTEIIYA